MDRVKKILNLSQIPSIDVEDNAGIIAAVKNVNPELTGKSDAEQMSIIQWLVFSEKPLTKEDIIKLEDLISTRSYLVGERLSIADIAVVACLPFDTFAISDVPNIFRWFQHVTSNLRQGIITGHKLVQPIIPIPLPVDSNAGVQITKPTSIEREDKKIVVAENNNEPVATVTTSSSEELDPSKLDIRVGLVVKCWNHPDSEKLLCEEIDLGEGSNRLIASGIRAHYCAEDVQGKKVLVLSNLKERSIAGFKSQVSPIAASIQYCGFYHFCSFRVWCCVHQTKITLSSDCWNLQKNLKLGTELNLMASMVNLLLLLKLRKRSYLNRSHLL